MTVPNKENFCGGAFDDWLEVMLIEKCNAACSWCCESTGFHPPHHATVDELMLQINTDSASKIILLGGEPLVYRDMAELLRGITPNKEVYITTNGILLDFSLVRANLRGIRGLNISIHHYDLERNAAIMNARQLEQNQLEYAIVECRRQGISVRFNCNIIAGQIDTRKKVYQYINWARERGVDRIRFAELKGKGEGFVSLARIFNGEHGLNENPYVFGCNKNATIDGMPINFRQMCGLQTSRRERPMWPKNVNEKVVLYYDGNYYNGWQSQRR